MFRNLTSFVFKFVFIAKYFSLFTSCEAIVLSCSQSSTVLDNVVDFVSPLFPAYLDDDLTCEVSVKLRPSYTTLR